jgi:pyruvate formate lyase activating enzyme
MATIEPIEKVGFFHFLPGAKAYYLESIDQNIACPSCPPETAAAAKILRPIDQVIVEAKNSGARIISLAASSNPAINDYNFNLAKLAEQNNFRVTLLYGSCLETPALKNILPYLDAVEIKTGDMENNFCAKNYESADSAWREKIQAVKAVSVHLEISGHLTAASSSLAEINKFIAAVKDSAGNEAIIHFLPANNLADASLTNIIIAAREQALRAGLKYVYTGGFDYPSGESTYCADGTIALERQNDFLLRNNLTDGRCADGTVIPGVWK